MCQALLPALYHQQNCTFCVFFQLIDECELVEFGWFGFALFLFFKTILMATLCMQYLTTLIIFILIAVLHSLTEVVSYQKITHEYFCEYIQIRYAMLLLCYAVTLCILLHII